MNVTVISNFSTKHNERILLNAFPKGATSKLSNIFFTLSFMLSAKQEAVTASVFEVLTVNQLGIKLCVHGLVGGRS